MKKLDKAYIAGVLHGDGYCTEKAIGICVADKDFAQAFALAVSSVYGGKAGVSPSHQYWRHVRSNKSGKFNGAKAYEPVADREKAQWIRGLFDSEGNAQLALNVGEKRYTHRRVSMYSTELPTLERAAQYLTDLGIKTRLRSTKNSTSHIGDKVVHELALRDKADFERFRDIVGSELRRKRQSLDAIVDSYVTHDYARRAQLLGAAAKRKKTLTVTLPRVAAGIRELIDRGVKPTQRNCRSVPGYTTVQKLIAQADLVEMAESL